MQKSKTLSQLLAEFISSLSYEKLSENVIEMTKLSFLDWLGSGIAGSREVPGLLIGELASESGGNPQATLLTSGEKSSALNAALVNGTCSHILELDDVHKSSILHPAAPIIPAALSSTELVRGGGRKLIKAIVAGYDTAIRIGEAVTPSHYENWHTTGTCGTFGAAAATAKVLELDTGKIVHSIGNAGSQAAGLWEFIENGAMTKHLHPGKAAMNGLMSSFLALKGFSGATTILEGKRGFFNSTAKEHDPGKITDRLGSTYKIEENCFKIHSSCRHTHPVLDLIINLAVSKDIKPGEVISIKIGTYSIALDVTYNFTPQTLYDAKFSLPFCTALGLHARSAGLKDFNTNNLNNPEILELMQKVEIYTDQKLDALYPACWPAKVIIETTEGTFAKETFYPKGDPENPLSRQELEEKFSKLVSPVLGEKKARYLIETVRDLEEIDQISKLTNSIFD